MFKVADLYLSLEELRQIVADLKEQFQREANQGIRKHSPDGQLQGLAALAKMEAAESFLYNCSLRAGEYSPATAASHQSPGTPKKKTRGEKVTQLPAPVPVIRKRIGGAE